MRLADQPVQIRAAGHVLCKQNAMVGTKTPDHIGIRIRKRIHAAKRCHALLRKHAKKPDKNLCCRRRIVHRAMMMRIDDIQELSDGVQVVGFMSREHHSCHAHGIDGGKRCRKPEVLCILPDKADVEPDVMSDQNAALAELQKSWQHLLHRICGKHHLIRNTGKAGNPERNRHLRIDKFREVSCFDPLLIAHRADFDDPVILRRKAGGLDIENNVVSRLCPILPGCLTVICKGGILPGFPEGYHLLQVIDKVAFHAVDHLEKLLAVNRRESFCLPSLALISVKSLHEVIGVRKGLHISVVRDGNRRPPPLIRPFDKILALRDAVHIAHLRVHMKLHALLFKIVPALGLKGRNFHDAGGG